LWSSVIGGEVCSFNVQQLIPLEPNLAHARGIAKRVFCDLIPAVSLLFDEWFPEEKEREEFGTQVVRELQNADHHLYFTMYEI